MQIHDQTPISIIREQQQESPTQKIARLEAELAAAKEETLTVMDATAFLYEELQLLKGEVTN
ncbi:hypothetical protein [Brevibacillus centrosporus]|uniref:hypothetical protein n=1 Tax=Brevibacillus centrosporus TaxID=54910 RepID=UPI002E235398|nr:hypothetical protein [Brevibacillus centrosporus]